MRHKQVTVLIFEDEPAQFEILLDRIRGDGEAGDAVIRWCRNGATVTDEDGNGEVPLRDADMIERNVDLIMVDLRMGPVTKDFGSFGGLTILKRIFGIAGHCRSVVAMTDFTQDIAREQENQAVREAIEELEQQEELIVVDRLAGRAKGSTLFRQIIASRRGRRLLSPQVERQILFLGRTDDPVLILGERGSGKEGIAHSIHRAWCANKGEDRPFESLNAGMFQYELMRAELFGYAESAFTGASRKGLLALLCALWVSGGGTRCEGESG